MAFADSAVTPYRVTTFKIDIAEQTLTRPPWRMSRSAEQIGSGRLSGAPRPTHIWPVGEDAYILRPFGAEMLQVARTDVGGFVDEGDVDLARGFERRLMWRIDDDIEGMGASPEFMADGFPAFQKGIAAGDSADARLEADEEAYPGPVDEVTQSIPLDRVLASRKTFRTRCPFFLIIGIPDNWAGDDALLRFYFGGPTDVIPESPTGGEFALTLRGGGDALLQERDSSDDENPVWLRRREFQWSEPHQGLGNIRVITVVPYALNRILFVSNSMFASAAGATGTLGLLTTIAARLLPQPARRSLYVDTPRQTGHAHLAGATGPGPVRMDVRRNLLEPVSIIEGKYPPAGVVPDGPFLIPHYLAAGTAITLLVDGFAPTGTTITPRLYDADTHTALAQNGAGQFLVPANGKRRFYATFTLESDEGGKETPVLWGYRVAVDGAIQTLAPTPVTMKPTQVSIIGPDLAPDHDGANVVLKDIRDEASILRTRDRIRSLVLVTDTRDGATSVLFEGETVRAVGKKRGIPGKSHPDPDWRDYRVPLVGMWARLAENFTTFLYDFSVDANAPVDPRTGQQPPWKITDILVRLLLDAGFPLSQIDIPDWPVRLWPNADARPADRVIPPGQEYVRLIRRFAQDYLGSVFLWDGNAGAAGMWRLLPNAAPPYTNFLASFYTVRPVAAGRKNVMHVDAFGANTAMIVRDTFNEYVKAPEANVILVYGGAQGDGSPLLLMQHLRNEASISNTASADYLGRCIPYLRIDPLLKTQQEVDWVARRLYAKIARAQTWLEFEAPLLFVTDPLDAQQVRKRPLRINDLVYVNGVACMVRSCNPHIDRSDRLQLAWHEVVVL